MTQTLWKLSQELAKFENLISDILDSELSNEEQEQNLEKLFDTWANLSEEFEQKCEAVAAYIHRLEVLTNVRKEESKRLKDLAESSQKQATQLRDYLVHNMQQQGKTKIEGTTVKLSLRKKPDKVILTVPVQEIPPEYQRLTIEPRIEEIKKLLKSEQVSWASIKENNDYSLIIK